MSPTFEFDRWREFLNLKSDEVQTAMIDRISTSGGDDVVDQLGRIVVHPGIGTSARLRAILVLGRCGDERCLPYLIRRLKRCETGELDALGKALASFADRARDAMLEALESGSLAAFGRGRIVTVLLNLFPGTVQQWRRRLDSDGATYAVAAKNLAHAGSEGRALLLNQLKGLGTLSYADVVRIYEEGGADGSTKVDAAIFESQDNDATLLALLVALGGSGDDTTTDVLTGYLSDENPEVRQQAAKSLAALDWQPPTDELRIQYVDEQGEEPKTARFRAATPDLLWREIQETDTILSQDLLALGEALLEKGGQPEAVELFVDRASAVDLASRMLECTKEELDDETLRRFAKIKDLHVLVRTTAPEHDNWAYAPETDEERTVDRGEVRRIARAELERRSGRPRR